MSGSDKTAVPLAANAAACDTTPSAAAEPVAPLASAPEPVVTAAPQPESCTCVPALGPHQSMAVALEQARAFSERSASTMARTMEEANELGRRFTAERLAGRTGPQAHESLAVAIEEAKEFSKRSRSTMAFTVEEAVEMAARFRADRARAAAAPAKPASLPRTLEESIAFANSLPRQALPKTVEESVAQARRMPKGDVALTMEEANELGRQYRARSEAAKAKYAIPSRLERINAEQTRTPVFALSGGDKPVQGSSISSPSFGTAGARETPIYPRPARYVNAIVVRHDVNKGPLGGIIDVGAGTHRTIGVDEANRLYESSGGDFHYVHGPGAFGVTVSYADVAWALVPSTFGGYLGEIYRQIPDGDWEPITRAALPELAADLAVGSEAGNKARAIRSGEFGDAQAVSVSGSVPPKWTPTGDAAIRVGVGGTGPVGDYWIVRPDGSVSKVLQPPSANFPERALDVAVGVDGSVFAVGDLGGLYVLAPKAPTWTQLAQGGAKAVSVSTEGVAWVANQTPSVLGYVYSLGDKVLGLFPWVRSAGPPPLKSVREAYEGAARAGASGLMQLWHWGKDSPNLRDNPLAVQQNVQAAVDIGFQIYFNFGVIFTEATNVPGAANGDPGQFMAHLEDFKQDIDRLAKIPGFVEHVRYLSIGNEVDEYFRQTLTHMVGVNVQAAWKDFASFFELAVGYCRVNLPYTRFGLSFTHYGLRDILVTYTDEFLIPLRNILAASDYLGITYYPGAVAVSAALDLPATDFPAFLDMADQLSGADRRLPVVVQEVGLVSVEEDVPEATEPLQKTFVTQVLAAWMEAGRRVPFLAWFELYDWPTIKKSLAYGGLLHTDGSPKPAYAAFKDFVAKKVAERMP